MSDIRRPEELSLLKPPDDPSKKKKKEKNSPQDDIWDIDILSGGPGGTGSVFYLNFFIWDQINVSRPQFCRMSLLMKANCKKKHNFIGSVICFDEFL